MYTPHLFHRLRHEIVKKIALLLHDLLHVRLQIRWHTKNINHTPNANMADHSVGARDELHESEASEASVFCFDNASPEKSCFVDGLVCLISLRLLVFVFLNVTRRDRNCATFASKGN